MPIPFSLLWSQNGTLIHGGSVSKVLVYPAMFPGKTSLVQKISLTSSAQVNGTFEILNGVKFYLTGTDEDLDLVQGQWPNLGFAYNPPRSEMDGGLQISFDGNNWITFSRLDPHIIGSQGIGDKDDPSTWLELPGVAIGLNGADGGLGPYDVATIYLRYVVPDSHLEYRIFDINLAVDCDVV